jgi:ribose 5-phosphate isomerase B
MNKVIFLGSDHAGYELKMQLVPILEEAGYTIEDKGTYSEERCDYPDYAHAVAKGIKDTEGAIGLLVCGSGNGISIAANKHEHVRAALCWNRELGELARAHNNANVLSLPARFIDEETAKDILKGFINTNFEGGRHEKRVEKISAC